MTVQFEDVATVVKLINSGEVSDLVDGFADAFEQSGLCKLLRGVMHDSEESQANTLRIAFTVGAIMGMRAQIGNAVNAVN